MFLVKSIVEIINHPVLGLFPKQWVERGEWRAAKMTSLFLGKAIEQLKNSKNV
jgi:hypothetical protein